MPGFGQMVLAAKALAAAAVALLAAGCAMQPTVSRTTTTLGEVDMAGLECREDRAVDSNMPRTICASPQVWRAYDRDQERRNTVLFDEIENQPNISQFGRRP